MAAMISGAMPVTLSLRKFTAEPRLGGAYRCYSSAQDERAFNPRRDDAQRPTRHRRARRRWPAARPPAGDTPCRAVADAPVPQAMDLAIVYEDAHLLVLDKPAGLVVHPAPGNPDHTLVNALLAHCGASLAGIGGVKRPGIVHRLDRD